MQLRIDTSSELENTSRGAKTWAIDDASVGEDVSQGTLGPKLAVALESNGQLTSRE